MSEPTIAQRVNHIKKAWHEGRPAYGIITKAPGQSLVRTLAGLRRYGLDVGFILLYFLSPSSSSFSGIQRNS
jgi:hypothetical protein